MVSFHRKTKKFFKRFYIYIYIYIQEEEEKAKSSLELWFSFSFLLLLLLFFSVQKITNAEIRESNQIQKKERKKKIFTSLLLLFLFLLSNQVFEVNLIFEKYFFLSLSL